MGLSRAEKNRRKRERKKRQKEEERKWQLDKEAEKSKEDKKSADNEDDVEIEYVSEAPVDIANISQSSNDEASGSLSDALRKFYERSTVQVTDDEGNKDDALGDDDFDAEDDEQVIVSKKKQKLENRPTVAELKNRVERADLVEAHDITSADPDFLLFLKAQPGTIPVPRHWGRKRKYLQGKVSVVVHFLHFFVSYSDL